MGVLSTVTKLLQASSQSTDRGDGTEAPTGAYWCDDCGERIPETEVDGGPPDCPTCGDAMTFERSPGTTGCAC